MGRFDNVARAACAELKGLQHWTELSELLDLVSQVAPAIVVEIGTRTGATLWAFSVAAPDALLVSIDPTNQRRALENLVGRERELHLLAARSQDTATLIGLERILDGRPIDFLFIDGDHSLQAVTADVALYGPLLAPDGLLALHDVVAVRPEASDVGVLWKELGRLPGALLIHDADGEPPFGIGVLPAASLRAPSGAAGAREVEGDPGQARAGVPSI